MTLSVDAARLVRIIAVCFVSGCNTVRVEGAQHPPPDHVLEGGSGPIEQYTVGLVLVGLDHTFDRGRKVFVHLRIGDGEVGMPGRGKGEHSVGFYRLLVDDGKISGDETDRGVDPEHSRIFSQELLSRNATHASNAAS